MWNRKEIKKKGKQVVKTNYWTAIIVCFLLALFTGEFGTSIVGIWQSDDSMDPNYVLNNERFVADIDFNIDELRIGMEFFNEEEFKESLTNTQEKFLGAVDATLNSVMKPQKFIFKIWDATKLFIIERQVLAVALLLAAIVAILFTILIADPLIVGGKRYFLKARKEDDAKVTELVHVFKKEHWLNVAWIMFLRNLFNALWYLTIIGGVIKTYEYRMIPFILAENPGIKRKEAFGLSKQMMKGNKWNVFVLDISFFGWYLLSVFTFGILSILYINPYTSATTAELYMEIRAKAIKEKFTHYELLQQKEFKL